MDSWNFAKMGRGGLYLKVGLYSSQYSIHTRISFFCTHSCYKNTRNSFSNVQNINHQIDNTSHNFFLTFSTYFYLQPLFILSIATHLDKTCILYAPHFDLSPITSTDHYIPMDCHGVHLMGMFVGAVAFTTVEIPNCLKRGNEIKC